MARDQVWYKREPVEILRSVRTEGGQLRSGRTKAARVEYSACRWLHCPGPLSWSTWGPSCRDPIHLIP